MIIYRVSITTLLIALGVIWLHGLGFFGLMSVRAQNDDAAVVSAQVRLSICGDGIIEGPEDCEGGMIANNSCLSLGYAGGELSCDIACTFDTSSCMPSPPPTVSASISSVTSDQVSVLTPTQRTDSVSDSPEASPTISNVTLLQPFISELSPSVCLPPDLAVFASVSSCRLSMLDLNLVVSVWAEEWKRAQHARVVGEVSLADTTLCDLNQDNQCDIRDFSILMYVVDAAAESDQ